MVGKGLNAHKFDCKGVNKAAVKTIMSQEGKNTLKFINHHKRMAKPYVIYADFESLITKIDSNVKAKQEKHLTMKLVVLDI